jgi:hypothetical protein
MRVALVPHETRLQKVDINNLMVAGISLKDQKLPLFFYKPK